MFFNVIKELVLRDKTEQGPLLQYVSGAEKETLARVLNGDIKSNIARNSLYLVFRNDEMNVVEEVINRAPMYLNVLKNRGYKNILFVTHFNAGQLSWILGKGDGRMVEVFPPERSHLQSMVDINIALQFLPMIHHYYGYKGDFKIIRPAESHHRGIMHALYASNNMFAHTLDGSSQYKHGKPSHNIETPALELFDAVVFLGVPKVNGETTFTAQSVREVFAPLCTPDFEMVDIYYGPGDKTKWVDGVRKDITADLDFVFANRSDWDPEVKTAGGRPEEYELMRRIISVY